jgi:hypothetical protein
VTAAAGGALLLSRNASDLAGIATVAIAAVGSG